MTDEVPYNTLIVDIETSVVKDRKGKWRSMPWDLGERPVGASPTGILFGASYARTHNPGIQIGAAIFTKTLNSPPHDSEMLVGHNIKFDAAHVPGIRKHHVWDTMIAEYILSAQQTKFASLADLTKKYAPTMAKADLISDSLALGVPPQDIPLATLDPYLRNDLEITSAVFKAQWAAATQPQRALILVQSSASLVYGEMEENGLTLDVAETIRQREEADARRYVAENEVRTLWETHVGKTMADDMVRADFLMSPTALSMWFFGSPHNHTINVPLTDTEKVGKPKSRVNRKLQITPPQRSGRLPILLPTSVSAKVRAGSAVFTTNDEVLEAIWNAAADPYHRAMVSAIREYRRNEKLSSTYFAPWLEEIENTVDRRLHPTIHSTATDTGRTSCSNPNGQNIPDEPKKCITSRYDSGMLLEADFKQLEVCGLAEVSKCPDLIAALKRGDDIHYLSGRDVYRWGSPSEMTKDERRVVKTINFGLMYGGSAKTLAAQAGVDIEIVKKLIRGFYRAFPGVEKWQTAMIERVTNSPDRTEVVASAEGTTQVNIVTTETGRSYAFPLEASKYRPGEMTPSPTKVKNYPVQGFATGDIVPLAVLLVREAVSKITCIHGTTNTVLPLLVVHDSILLDLPATCLWDDVKATITRVVENDLPRAIKDLWGIELAVPLSVDFHLSPTWKERI